jgi:hypothetical protein
MRSYNLDPKSAAAAGAANYISETGKYIGTFTRAEIITSRAGTEGVEFSFTDQSGLRCDYLSLWTYNKDGEPLPSLKVLNAIMACLRLRTLDPQPISVTRHDGTTEQANGFPALTGKPIGVLLQREAYIKNNGDEGYKFNLFAPFDAATELTAGEILAKKSQPEQLAKMIAVLKDKPLSGNKANGTTAVKSSSQSFDNMDDDIPF